MSTNFNSLIGSRKRPEWALARPSTFGYASGYALGIFWGILLDHGGLVGGYGWLLVLLTNTNMLKQINKYQIPVTNAYKQITNVCRDHKYEQRSQV